MSSAAVAEKHTKSYVIDNQCHAWHTKRTESDAVDDMFGGPL